MTKQRHAISERRYQNSNIRAKLAPVRIETTRDALEAFERLAMYRAMEHRNRLTGYTKGGGTGTLAVQRSDSYSEVADAWHDALHDWLRRQL